MVKLNLFKKNKLLGFVTGFLIFVFLIPGCFYLKSNPSPINSQIETPTPQIGNPVTFAKRTNLPNSLSPLGVNLNGISDWSTQFPFLDVFKSALISHLPRYTDLVNSFVNTPRPAFLPTHSWDWVSRLEDSMKFTTREIYVCAY